MIHDLIWGHSQVCSNLPDGRGLAPTSSTKDGIHSCHLTSNAVAGEMLLHCAYPACCCIQRRVLLCAVSPSQPKFFFSCYYFVTLIKLQAGAVQLILFTWYFILYCRGAFGKMQFSRQQFIPFDKYTKENENSILEPVPKDRLISPIDQNFSYLTFE